MSISLDQIDELRKRVSVSYADAKEALENCDGDMLEAIVYLEKNNKARLSYAGKKTGFAEKINRLIKKGSKVRCIIHKQDNIILNLSLNMVILLLLILSPLFWLIALCLLAAMLTGHRIKLKSSDNSTSKINETLDKICDAVGQAKEKFTEPEAQDQKVSE